ncbi:transcription factor HES-1-B-like [Clavelina lepadiformis]
MKDLLFAVFVQTTSKLLKDKSRRKRIKNSLNELISILLNILGIQLFLQQRQRHSKLEKADILEMTVRYLKEFQGQTLNAAKAIDPRVTSKYRSGFVECKNEVSHTLENTNAGIQPDVKTRLMNHLGSNVPPPLIPSSSSLLIPFPTHFSLSPSATPQRSGCGSVNKHNVQGNFTLISLS